MAGAPGTLQLAVAVLVVNLLVITVAGAAVLLLGEVPGVSRQAAVGAVLLVAMINLLLVGLCAFLLAGGRLTWFADGPAAGRQPGWWLVGLTR